MSTDRHSAQEQWHIAHRQVKIVIDSLEMAPYTQLLAVNAAQRILKTLDKAMRRILQ